jgi:hypothetical protein
MIISDGSQMPRNIGLKIPVIVCLSLESTRTRLCGNGDQMTLAYDVLINSF